jgi:hypothetical protein
MKLTDKSYEGLNFQRVKIVFTGFGSALSGKYTAGFPFVCLACAAYSENAPGREVT